VSTNTGEARAIERGFVAEPYLALTNYVKNLLRFGYIPEDIADGGSDRLADDLVLHGTPKTIAAGLCVTSPAVALCRAVAEGICSRSDRSGYWGVPPLTSRLCPLTQAARPDARYSAASATSSTVPIRLPIRL
jgi:hypothetical protein